MEIYIIIGGILLLLVLIGSLLSYEEIQKTDNVTLPKEELNKELELSEQIGHLTARIEEKENIITELHATVENLTTQLTSEENRNKTVVSEKQSVLVRTGAIVENIVPLLQELPYNSKNLHHLGQPIDFIYFNYDEPEPYITFIEVKSGNAKESKRQKIIKKIIEQNKVHYELLQITDKGIKVTRKV